MAEAIYGRNLGLLFSKNFDFSRRNHVNNRFLLEKSKFLEKRDDIWL